MQIMSEKNGTFTRELELDKGGAKKLIMPNKDQIAPASSVRLQCSFFQYASFLLIH